MSETSSDTDMMSEEHVLDFVLEASNENQNFAASNVAEIMENFVCPPSDSPATSETTYTDLSSKTYCTFESNSNNYVHSPTSSSSPNSQVMYYQDVTGSSPEWEDMNVPVNYEATGWPHQQNNYTFAQQIDCTINSGYSEIPNFAGTHQPFQVKDFLGLSAKALTQQHHVTRRQNSGSSTKSSKRRRVTTVSQRKAANVRERRRMFNLNEAFDLLRKRVPAFSYEKRLSRIDTLRLAVIYIGFMQDVVDGKPVDEVKLRELQSQFAILKKANALPSASRPKPRNSTVNGNKATRSSNRARKTDNIKI
ncbi:uncharacterized protein [Amphiura filiformis]|uniref:uncharacterized protein n=1 Tax=Amphiura filiformis TaxID=82378 RepID=UPI003B21EF23